MGQVIGMLIGILIVVAIGLFILGTGIYAGVSLRENNYSLFRVTPVIIVFLAKVIGIWLLFERMGFNLGSIIIFILAFGLICGLSHVLYMVTTLGHFPIYHEVLLAKFKRGDHQTEMGISLLKIIILEGFFLFLLEGLTIAVLPIMIIAYYFRNKFFHKIAESFGNWADDEIRPWINVETGKEYSFADSIIDDDLKKHNIKKDVENTRKDKSDKIYDGKRNTDSIKYKGEKQSFGIFTPNDYNNIEIKISPYGDDRIKVELDLIENASRHELFEKEYIYSRNSDTKRKLSEVIASDIEQQSNRFCPGINKEQIRQDVWSKLP